MLELSLRNNNFYGTVPSILGDIPNLTYLDLRNNYFVGTVPSSFSKIHNRGGMVLLDEIL